MKARSSRFARMSSRILRERLRFVAGGEPLGRDEDRLRGLLRDGRAALDLAPQHVGVHRGAERAEQVDAAVLEEVLVLRGDEGLDEPLRDPLVGDDLAPLVEELAGDLAVGEITSVMIGRPVLRRAWGSPAARARSRGTRPRPRRRRRSGTRWRGRAPSAARAAERPRGGSPPTTTRTGAAAARAAGARRLRRGVGVSLAGVAHRRANLCAHVRESSTLAARGGFPPGARRLARAGRFMRESTSTSSAGSGASSAQRRARDRVRERELPGVEEHAREPPALLREPVEGEVAVAPVARHGVAGRLEVAADLVRAPGLDRRPRGATPPSSTRRPSSGSAPPGSSRRAPPSTSRSARARRAAGRWSRSRAASSPSRARGRSSGRPRRW